MSQSNQQGKKPRNRWMKKPLMEPSMYLVREASEPVDSMRPKPLRQGKSPSEKAAKGLIKSFGKSWLEQKRIR